MKKWLLAFTAIELGVFISIVGTTSFVVVKVLRPTWRCALELDETGRPETNYCTTMSGMAIRNSGMIVCPHVNWRSRAACERICTSNVVAQADGDPWDDPSMSLVIEGTVDGTNWVQLGKAEVPLDDTYPQLRIPVTTNAPVYTLFRAVYVKDYAVKQKKD